MFYGNSVQIISGKEEDTTPFEIKSDSVSSNQLCVFSVIFDYPRFSIT